MNTRELPTVEAIQAFVCPLEEDEYAEGLVLYRQRTDVAERMLHWFRTFAEQSISAEPANLSLLSIGCGNGNFDLPALDILKSKFQTLQYAAIEPNQTLCQQIAIELKEPQNANVSFRLRCCRFEELSTAENFDLIVFANCLNFIADRRHALAKALSMLNSGGCVLIFNPTRNGYQDLRLELSARVGGYVTNVCLPKEIEEVLGSLDAEFVCDYLKSETDVTDCFDGTSYAGARLLDFILGGKIPHVDNELRNTVTNNLKSLCSARDGRMFMPHSVAVFQARTNR
jgi:SAM-dependent methyltransferase